MGREPYGIGPRKKEPDEEVMKKQRQYKRMTRPKTRRPPELFTEPVRSNNNMDRQEPRLREKKRTMKILNFYFPDFKGEESPSGGHREGRLYDQPGSKKELL